MELKIGRNVIGDWKIGLSNFGGIWTAGRADSWSLSLPAMAAKSQAQPRG